MPIPIAPLHQQGVTGKGIIIMPNLKVPTALADATPAVTNQPQQSAQPEQQAPVPPKPKKTRGIR
jgi:hypothetical protein